MPAEFLLPLFVVTLVANAVLVAFAIRGLTRGDFERDHRAERSGPGGGARTQPAMDRSGVNLVPGPTAAPGPAGAQPPAADPVMRSNGRMAPAAADPLEPPRPALTPAPAPTIPVESRPAGHSRSPARTPSVAKARAARDPGADASPKRRAAPGRPADSQPSADRSEPKRGRRRFILPPLDDDHEKVNRSIKTFLDGDTSADAETRDAAPARGEPVDAGPPDALAAGAGPKDVGPVREVPTVGVPTTVALVAVSGLPTSPVAGEAGTGRRVRAARAGSGDPAVAAALAMVERTIRGAARASDVVAVTGPGRYRIVLAGTGELAARAYLRRIRATVEPLLQADDGSLRLAVGTATVLDESVAEGTRRANQRLAVALEALERAGRQGPSSTADGAVTRAPALAGDETTDLAEPRAAGD